MTTRLGRRLVPRAAGIAIACALPIAGCSWLNPPAKTQTGGTTLPITSASPTVSASASASPSPSADPTAKPSPSHSAAPTPSGPIVGAPAGAPVKPEVFLATVDTANGLLRVVVYVPGIFEDGGLCTVKVTDGSAALQKQATGASDVSSTACGQFTFALGDLPSGTASIVASYSSSKHAGSSAVTKVAIP